MVPFELVKRQREPLDADAQDVRELVLALGRPSVKRIEDSLPPDPGTRTDGWRLPHRIGMGPGGLRRVSTSSADESDRSRKPLNAEHMKSEGILVQWRSVPENVLKGNGEREHRPRRQERGKLSGKGLNEPARRVPSFLNVPLEGR